MLRRQKRLQPLRKLAAAMKKRRTEPVNIEMGETININTEEENNTDAGNKIEIRTPEYVPPVFSSPESEESPSVMAHTTMEIKTVDKLNYQTVSLILSERDKMRLAGIEKRHPLLFHFDRSLWSVLFATMQLLQIMPWTYSYDTDQGMKMFKFLLTTR